MSDEKLDLILNVVSDIKNRQEGLEKTVGKIVIKIDGLETRFDGLETRFDRLETKVDNLEIRFDNLETKVDNLDSEFKDFKKQVIELFISVQNRFAILEKQMVAIGVEIKAEIRTEIEAVGAKIDRLEKQILLDRTDTVENRMEIREIKQRLTNIENTINLTV